MSTDSRINSHYVAAGALKDARVMEALLGELPASHQMELSGFTLGLVNGDDINAQVRHDVVEPDFITRILVPNPDSSVGVRMYTGLTTEQLDRIAMFALEGIATQRSTISLGEIEAVGEAQVHCLRRGIPFEELPGKDREVFPNGFEGTIQAAEQTRMRFEERRRGPSPERR